MFVSRDGVRLSSSSRVFVLLMPDGRRVGGVVSWSQRRPAGFVFYPINSIAHAKDEKIRLEFEDVPDMPGLKRCSSLVLGKWTDKPTGAWNIVPKDEKWTKTES